MGQDCGKNNFEIRLVCSIISEMQKNRITQSIIIGLTTLVATATWAGLENILFKNGSWLWSIIGFLILLIFLSLNWLLTKSKIILLITFFFVLISFFFSFGFKLEYLMILFISFMFFYLASERAINEKKGRIKIKVTRILKQGLPFILTGLALIISTVYYFSPMALTGQSEIIIPRPLFDKIINPTQLTQQFDVNLGDDLYQKINQEINKQGQVYEEYITLGSAISIFFALKIIGVLFMWLVIILSWVIFKILVVLGAIKIQEQAVLKEVIEI